MVLTVEAIYENGVLKPRNALPLQEQELVQITIERPAEIQAALDAVERTYGLLPWTGDPRVVEQVALDPEFSVREAL